MRDKNETTHTHELTLEERACFQAEAERHLAEARKLAAEAANAEHEAVIALLEREKAELKSRRERWADPYEDRIYRFTQVVNEQTVTACINALNAWHREDPTCAMEVLFDSPGGSVVDGMHLYDHIIELRAAGHRIDTRTRGMAASMAGILLQAGETRTMGAQASLMIHEASFGASGKIGDVEDTVEWVKKIQERILDIFATRCQAAPTATKPLTKAALRNRWRRKNWWLDADEALRFGLIDRVA
jgi:ATP-dependent Clp endopeptidase proteolytic subunit ClpP